MILTVAFLVNAEAMNCILDILVDLRRMKLILFLPRLRHRHTKDGLRHTERTDRIKATQQLDFNTFAIVLSEFPHVFVVRTARRAIQFIRLSDLVQMPSAHEAACVNETGKRAHGVGAAGESEEIDLVTGVIVETEEGI